MIGGLCVTHVEPSNRDVLRLRRVQAAVSSVCRAGTCMGLMGGDFTRVQGQVPVCVPAGRSTAGCRAGRLCMLHASAAQR